MRVTPHKGKTRDKPAPCLDAACSQQLPASLRGRLPLRPLTTEVTPVRGRDGGAQTHSNEAEAAISSLPFSNMYVLVLPLSAFEGPGSFTGA